MSAWQHKHLSTRVFRHKAKSSQLQDALDVGLATQEDRLFEKRIQENSVLKENRKT